MVVVSIASGRDPYSTTMKSLRNLLEAGIHFPKITVVKPNVLSTDEHDFCNTDSRVCEAVVDFFLSQGNSEIICAEGATHGHPPDTLKAFRNWGYYKMEEKISRYVDFNEEEPGRWMGIVSPGVDYEVELGIARTAVENPVVSVAKFKTHDFLGLTLTMKNMMGSICKARRLDTRKVLAIGKPAKMYMHGWGDTRPDLLPRDIGIGPSRVALAKNLVKLASCVMPSSGVVDGIIAMEGNGPMFGTKKDLGVVIAGTDPVACDVVACEIAGFSAMETGYIHAAGRIGLGEYRLEEIEIVGEEIESVKRPLKSHDLFPYARFSREAVERLIEEIKEVM